MIFLALLQGLRLAMHIPTAPALSAVSIVLIRAADHHHHIPHIYREVPATKRRGGQAPVCPCGNA